MQPGIYHYPMSCKQHEASQLFVSGAFLQACFPGTAVGTRLSLQVLVPIHAVGVAAGAVEAWHGASRCRKRGPVSDGVGEAVLQGAVAGGTEGPIAAVRMKDNALAGCQVDPAAGTGAEMLVRVGCALPGQHVQMVQAADRSWKRGLWDVLIGQQQQLQVVVRVEKGLPQQQQPRFRPTP